ncbi:MAG TPA: nuclear transport factor 2 family protein [Chitinophagaceae bacterium]|nr:nuclear transport factor 2 family protein [Chitinophagaceae bacterium]
MRYEFIVPILSATLISTACTDTTDSVPKELEQAMQTRLEAVWTKDTAKWSRLTSEDFTIVVPEGMLLNKKQRIAQMKNESPEPIHKIDQQQVITSDEMVVRRFIDGTEWVLEVWSKKGGAWKVAAAQVNFVKK